MISTPMLALPDFSNILVVEADAFGGGIEAVLIQESHPLAYLSKALSPKYQILSIYEKESMAVVLAVER